MAIVIDGRKSDASAEMARLSLASVEIGFRIESALSFTHLPSLGRALNSHRREVL